DPTVLGAAVRGGVGGDRLIGPGTTGAQARRIDAVGGQVIGHGLGAALGQRHVVRAAAGGIGVTDDLDAVLVVLAERGSQVVQRHVEAAGDVRGIGGEGDVAGHHQLDDVTLALHLHTGALHAATQLGFLLIGVVAVAGTRRTTDGRADQRALAAILAARGRRADRGPRQSAQAAVDGGLVGAALFALIGVLAGTAGEQRQAGCDGGETTGKNFHGGTSSNTAGLLPVGI